MTDIQAAVSRRERVTVTSHGRPWAVLVAWEDCRPETPKASEFAAAGMWADRDDLSNPTEYVGKLREHLQPGGGDSRGDGAQERSRGL